MGSNPIGGTVLIADRAPRSLRLRRRSPTKSVSAPSSSARRRAIRDLIASLAKLARRGSRPQKPPTSSSVADEKRVGALRLSTAPRDPGFDCLARQARSGTRLEAAFRRLRYPTQDGKRGSFRLKTHPLTVSRHQKQATARKRG